MEMVWWHTLPDHCRQCPMPTLPAGMTQGSRGWHWESELMKLRRGLSWGWGLPASEMDTNLWWHPWSLLSLSSRCHDWEVRKEETCLCISLFFPKTFLPAEVSALQCCLWLCLILAVWTVKIGGPVGSKYTRQLLLCQFSWNLSLWPSKHIPGDSVLWFLS